MYIVHTNVAKPTTDEKMRYFKGDYASVNAILKLEAPRSLFSSPGYNNNINQ